MPWICVEVSGGLSLLAIQVIDDLDERVRVKVMLEGLIRVPLYTVKESLVDGAWAPILETRCA